MKATLTQAAIDKAFGNPQRQTKLVYSYSRTKITILNGKNTGRLDVVNSTAPSGEDVQVTSLERTLIDIAVRPVYAGGIVSVIDAYHSCRGRVSAARIAELLQKMDYRYPYAQAVGFLLQRSGYSTDEQSFFKNLATPFNFYLSYAMQDPLFDKDWRVFYPRAIR